MFKTFNHNPPATPRLECTLRFVNIIASVNHAYMGVAVAILILWKSGYVTLQYIRQTPKETSALTAALQKMEIITQPQELRLLEDAQEHPDMPVLLRPDGIIPLFESPERLPATTLKSCTVLPKGLERRLEMAQVGTIYG
jgi:hypothetical protein